VGALSQKAMLLVMARLHPGRGVNTAAYSQISNRLENGSETQYAWASLRLKLRGIQAAGTIENRRLDARDRLRQFVLESSKSG
jgi:hypothetical protein